MIESGVRRACLRAGRMPIQTSVPGLGNCWLSVFIVLHAGFGNIGGLVVNTSARVTVYLEYGVRKSILR